MSHHSSYYGGLGFGYGGFGGLGFGHGIGCGSFHRLGHGFGFRGYGYGSGYVDIHTLNLASSRKPSSPPDTMSHHSSYYRGLRFGYGGFGGLGFGPGFGCGSFHRLGHGFGFSGYGYGSGSGSFRHGCCRCPSFYGGYRFSSFL
ncbi:hypothetical protein Cadr_000001052 [Camelus dromedarius]|uniref:Keratin-associated protein 19-3 n=1 Tax=Camelus dromedarius TaxID=9838 RepID=A0A5N4EI22_CAMDR|nr:hypothetical protein Cadr_000001052 [Camelus dromedarius]